MRGSECEPFRDCSTLPHKINHLEFFFKVCILVSGDVNISRETGYLQFGDEKNLLRMGKTELSSGLDGYSCMYPDLFSYSSISNLNTIIK